MDDESINVEGWSTKAKSWIDFLKIFLDLVNQFKNMLMTFIGGIDISGLINKK